MELSTLLFMLVVRFLDRAGGRIVERLFNRHPAYEQPCQLALIALLCVGLALMLREKRYASTLGLIAIALLALGAGAFSRLI